MGDNTMKALISDTMQTLKKAMQVRSKKNDILASNIVNMDTPGYEAKDVPFEKIMQGHLKKAKSDMLATNGFHINDINNFNLVTTDKTHFDINNNYSSGNNLEISLERGTPNNVDIDVEMAKLAMNNLEYQSYVNSLIKQFDLLKTAITEGGGR
jgi:flagellar basal-body rod protein FlgB